MKKLMISLVVLLGAAQSANAYKVVCNQGAVDVVVKFVKSEDCKNSVGVYYSTNQNATNMFENGACVAGDLDRVLTNDHRLNRRYQACLRELGSPNDGNYLVTIDSIGQDLDADFILE